MAQTEVTLGNTAEIRHLKFGLIEDFDNNIGPELAVLFANGMPKGDFALYIRSSSEILDMLQSHSLDIGIASSPNKNTDQLKDFLMLRDSFVLAVPANCTVRPESFFAGSAELTMLHYAKDQQIRKQIAAHLQHLNIEIPVRFKSVSNQTMMAMIAASAGWAVTTPACYVRARRFHKQVQLHAFPAKGFANHLSLFAREECADEIVGTINAAIRNLIEMCLINPETEAILWLKNELCLLPLKANF